jgi:hypothetical protein
MLGYMPAKVIKKEGYLKVIPALYIGKKDSKIKD